MHFHLRRRRNVRPNVHAARLAVGPIEPLERRVFLSASDLDLSFGQSGRTVPGPFGDSSRFNDVKLLPDGKILAAGSRTLAVNGTDFLVARYNADGSVDTSFGSGAGFVTTDFTPATTPPTPYQDSINRIVLLSNGDFLVVGSSGDGSLKSGVAIARYKSDGSLDASFGGGTGKVLTTVTSGTETLTTTATGAALLSNGKLVVAGTGFGDAPGRFVLARYNTDGSLDTTFGTNGITATQYFYIKIDFGSGVPTDVASGMIASDLKVLPNGKLLVGGTADVAFDYGINQESYALARYNANGTVDTTFGDKGFVTAIKGDAETSDLVVRPNGSILLAGGRRYDDIQAESNTFSVAQFSSAGQIDRSFGYTQTGYSDTIFPIDQETNYRAYIDTMLALPNGQILVAGRRQNTYAQTPSELTVELLQSNGQLDPVFGDQGQLASTVLRDAQGSLLQPDGKLLLAGSYDVDAIHEQAAIVRFQSVGTSSVSGTIYEDLNSNGVQEDGEDGLAGWTAYADVNNNGRVDEGEPFAVTDDSGDYTIEGLAPGTYRIRELRLDGYARTQPAGLYPLGFYDLVIAADQDLTANNFGNVLPGAGAPPDLNDPPLGIDDDATTAQDTSVVIDVLANDSDDNALEPGSVAVASDPSNGVVVVNPVTGWMTYTPRNGFSGDDSFTYTVQDDQGLASDPVTVSVEVTPASLASAAVGTLPTAAIAGAKTKGKAAVMVTNSTGDLVQGQVTLKMYLSDDTSVDDTDAVIQEKSMTLKLKPGQAKQLKLKVGAFPTVSADTYDVLVQVTAPDGTASVAPAGTVSLATPYVELAASITQQPAAPLLTTKRQTLGLSVRNSGNVPATGSSSIKLYASQDGTLDDADTLLATTPVRFAIRPAGTKSLKLRFSLPAGLSGQSIRLIAVIDPDNAIAERNEDNNSVVSDELAVS